MWHSSAASIPPGHAAGAVLKSVALDQLAGVGDLSLEWHEWSGTAFHVRRRLTAAEQERVGPVVDCRDTAEWNKRFKAVRRYLPPQGLELAQQERYP